MHSAELDFRLEAANLVQVSANMRRARVVARVPAVVGALTSRRVLVMRFCEGDSLKVLQLYTSLDVVQHMVWSPDSKYLACGIYKRGLVQVRTPASGAVME